MQIVEREYLKENFPELISEIQKRHVMGEEIYNALYVDNVPVLNLCHRRVYFTTYGNQYFSYEMDHVIKNVEGRIIGRRLNSITFYDDFLEYTRFRNEGMNSVAPKDQTGINFN